jgi:hypothetical protein
VPLITRSAFCSGCSRSIYSSSLAHGLRNEMYFCAQVAPQAGSVLVFLRTKHWKYPSLKAAGASKRMLSSQMIALDTFRCAIRGQATSLARSPSLHWYISRERDDFQQTFSKCAVRFQPALLSFSARPQKASFESTIQFRKENLFYGEKTVY